MALRDVLTEPRLRALAGYAFERGQKYWYQGHVASWEAGDDALTGVVVGTQRYAVRIEARGSSLDVRCMCPVGDPMCKHAVALGLAFLAAPPPAPPPP
nr:hypothetical protein [Myxococcota bacterium]